MGLKSEIKKLISYSRQKEQIPIPQPVNAEKLLDDKIAMITGGSGGIGMAIAASFLRSGCKVVLCGTSEEKLQKCCQKLLTDTSSESTSVKGMVLDVTNISSFDQKVDQALNTFTEHRIDILVNAAGVRAKLKFFDTTEEEYDSVMDINTKGTYFMCQSVSKYMIDNNVHGHILNVTSSGALRPAWTPYQMSKWAIRGFTKGLADTLLPYGIIVNAIAPGPTATPMMGKTEGDDISKPGNPTGRYAMPSEIASLATFMVSDLGNLIVGDTYYITGGSGVISYKE